MSARVRSSIRLVETERMIVSEVPGTTRDSVDVHFQIDGQDFIAIDTPGLRKRKSVRTDLEFYGTHRAQRSVRRADVVLMFFDAAETISKVDKQLMGYVIENYKPCIFVINKWDLLHGTVSTDRWVKYLRSQFPTLAFAPIAFITGQTGKNVKALLNHSTMLFKQARSRVSTGVLNRLVRSAVDHASTTDVPKPSSQNLLRNAGGNGTADNRDHVQRTESLRERLPALSAQCAARSPGVW